MRIQICRSCADLAGARALFEEGATAVPADWAGALRDRVLAVKKPRPVLVQANTRLRPDGSVELLQYEPTAEGLARSFLDRFGPDRDC